MERLPGRQMRTMYVTFDARSIRDTGQCSQDAAGRKEPYPSPEIASGPSLVSISFITVKCLHCGRQPAKYTYTASESSHGTSPAAAPATPARPVSFRSYMDLANDRSGSMRQPLTFRTSNNRPLASLRGSAESAQPAVSPRQPLIYDLRGSTVVSITQGPRRSEPIGSEETDFDNSESSSSSVETLHLSQKTEFAMTVDQESATVGGGGGAVKLAGFADISGSLQQTLRKHHSVAATSTLTVERTSEIQVPAGKHIRVTLNWKRIWQDGTVNLSTRSGAQVKLPYSMTVDIGYDKKTTDIE